MRVGFGVVVAVGLGAGLPACFPYVIPPGQLEVGLARDVKARETLAHVTAGIHSASVPRLVDKPVDLGVGYGADLYGSKNGEASKVRVHGPYAEGSWFAYRWPRARVSFGVRGEMLIDSGNLGWDLLARSGAELFEEHRYVPGQYACEIHGGSGALAIGLYAESGYQQMPRGGHAFITTAGFTFRWPLMYGVVVYGCN